MQVSFFWSLMRSSQDGINLPLGRKTTTKGVCDMRKSHAAVWASDAPTPGQFAELFRQVGSGRVTRQRMDVFLGSLMTDAEMAALEILGKGKVLGYQDVCRVWQRDLPQTEPVLLYTEEILRQAAERNQGGEDWRMIYCTGLSLRGQLAVRDDDRRKQPCFDPDYEWWRESAQDGWATKAIEPGYRLLDFSCGFASMDWQKQTEAISASGDQFVRAQEQAVAEACFSNYLLNSKERLLQRRFHWGHMQAANSSLVCVGHFGDRGFVVNCYWGGYAHDYLGVVRAWKHPTAA